MPSNRKTRQQLVSECVGAVQRCWQWYCDEPISDSELVDLTVALSPALPEQFTTARWTAYMDEHYARKIDGSDED